MRHKGNNTDVITQRNDDLMHEYHKIINESEYILLDDIVCQLANMPAPRFYVSEERAAFVLSAMHHGKKLKGMQKNKKQMFQELYRRAKKIIKNMKTVDWTDWIEIAHTIIVQPAPKFYITPGSIKVVISRAKIKWYEQKKKKLKHLFF